MLSFSAGNAIFFHICFQEWANFFSSRENIKFKSAKFDAENE
jgi:hypothetical protein